MSESEAVSFQQKTVRCRLLKMSWKNNFSGKWSQDVIAAFITTFSFWCRSALTGVVEDGQRARAKKRRRLYKSESEGFSCPPPPLALQPKSHSDVMRPLEAKPFPVGIRTIGSFHGAMTNSRLNQHLLQASFTNAAVHKQESEARNHCLDSETHRVKTVVHGNVTAFRQQKLAHSSAQRGRRRAHSSPVFSPLVVGGENYSLASPSVRIRTEERGRLQFNRFHHQTRWDEVCKHLTKIIRRVFSMASVKLSGCQVFFSPTTTRSHQSQNVKSTHSAFKVFIFFAKLVKPKCQMQ